MKLGAVGAVFFLTRATEVHGFGGQVAFLAEPARFVVPLQKHEVHQTDDLVIARELVHPVLHGFPAIRRNHIMATDRTRELTVPSLVFLLFCDVHTQTFPTEGVETRQPFGIGEDVGTYGTSELPV